ncbi:MAG TPA: peptidylprolyl isomerase, partial [Agitococcus sp.]|nr:peptidylprolyl isomerase [Agitococcus sp.]
DELSVGLVVSFADKSKAELAGVVKEITEQQVTVDFNHPLASRDLLFEVDIISVRDISEQPFTLKG